MSDLTHSARRLPQLPARDSLPPEELADFDLIVQRIARGFGPTKEAVDGRPYGEPHFSALGVSPPLAAAVSRLGNAVMARQDEPGSFSAHDHELVDMVLPLDSGYYALLAGHTPAAIAGGVRIAAIEALRDGRTENLTEEERGVVTFIRAVRDETMTDELWQWMEQRIGTTRGVVEFLYQILLLVFHFKFLRAVGAPAMRREDFDQMLAEFKDGTRPTPMTYTERMAKSGPHPF